MNKKILLSSLLLTSIFPGLAFAISIEGMIDAAVRTTFYIASGVVVILWIITGLWFLTAQGAPEKLSAAKRSLIAAVAGTILIVVAASAISIVGSAFGIRAF
jgi:glucose uptake protein GlcU